MVVLGGGGGSHERGTPLSRPHPSPSLSLSLGTELVPCSMVCRARYLGQRRAPCLTNPGFAPPDVLRTNLRSLVDTSRGTLRAWKLGNPECVVSGCSVLSHD